MTKLAERQLVRIEPASAHHMRLAEYTERELGIESLSYSAQHDLASATIKALEDYEPPQSLAQRTMVITADDPDFA